MKVLMIGGDKRSLESGTRAAARLELQRSVVERLDLLVWPHAHSAFAIMRAALSGRYDVITAQDPFWRGLIALIAARISGARLNVQVHTDLTAYRGMRRALAQIVLRNADSVRTVSERIREQVGAYGARERVSVLPVFVDLERFRACAHRPHSGKNILWIGRFEDEKDPLRAIAVWKEVRAGIPDAVLIMIGEGSLTDALSRAAAQAGGTAIRVLPWQHDLSPALETADVVLSTSKHESWGQSIIEALAAGVPVVAPDVGVAREAGARVVSRDALAKTVADVLRSGTRGTLRLHLHDVRAWARAWKQTL